MLWPCFVKYTIALEIHTISGEFLTNDNPSESLAGAAVNAIADEFKTADVVYDFGDIKFDGEDFARHSPALHALAIRSENAGQAFADLIKNDIDSVLQYTLFDKDGTAISGSRLGNAEGAEGPTPPDDPSDLNTFGRISPEVLYRALWKGIDNASLPFYDYFHDVFSNLTQAGAAGDVSISVAPPIGDNIPIDFSLHSGVTKIALQIVRDALQDTADLQGFAEKLGENLAGSGAPATIEFAGGNGAGVAYADRLVLDVSAIIAPTENPNSEQVDVGNKAFGVRDINSVIHSRVASSVDDGVDGTDLADKIFDATVEQLASGAKAIPDWNKLVVQAGGDTALNYVASNDDNGADKFLIIGGAQGDQLEGSFGNDIILGGSGNDIITGLGGGPNLFDRDMLFGEDGDDEFRILVGDGDTLVVGGKDTDTVKYLGSTSNIEIVSIGQVDVNPSGDTVLGLEVQRDIVGGVGTDILTGVEIAIGTELADRVVLSAEAFEMGLTIDLMGVSQGGGRDILDVSGLGFGVVFENGVLRPVDDETGDLTINVLNAGHVILTGQDDKVLSVGAGTVLEVGGGADEVYVENGVGVADLGFDDRITIFGAQTLFGGVRVSSSESPYASGLGGLVEYGLNAIGELVIRLPGVNGAEMFVLNWLEDAVDQGSGGAQLGPGNITLAEIDVWTGRLLDDNKPSGLTQKGFWEVFGLTIKTMVGWNAWGGGDPLVLDLDGDGIELTTLNSISPQYDIDYDLYAEQTAFAKGDDGVLARDINGDGVINDASELFGYGTTSGFSVLSTLDGNLDGVVNAGDNGLADFNGDGTVDANDTFGSLLVWQDADRDVQSDAGDENFPLAFSANDNIPSCKLVTNGSVEIAA